MRAATPLTMAAAVPSSDDSLLSPDALHHTTDYYFRYYKTYYESRFRCHSEGEQADRRPDVRDAAAAQQTPAPGLCSKTLEQDEGHDAPSSADGVDDDGSNSVLTDTPLYFSTEEKNSYPSTGGQRRRGEAVLIRGCTPAEEKATQTTGDEHARCCRPAAALSDAVVNRAPPSPAAGEREQHHRGTQTSLVSPALLPVSEGPAVSPAPSDTPSLPAAAPVNDPSPTRELFPSRPAPTPSPSTAPSHVASGAVYSKTTSTSIVVASAAAAAQTGGRSARTARDPCCLVQTRAEVVRRTLLPTRTAPPLPVPQCVRRTVEVPTLGPHYVQRRDTCDDELSHAEGDLDAPCAGMRTREPGSSSFVRGAFNETQVPSATTLLCSQETGVCEEATTAAVLHAPTPTRVHDNRPPRTLTYSERAKRVTF